MYLSKLLIKNYKSIDLVDIELCKGKNVIVGKNNSGKSNIIKALDLVLGESSPTYAKSDNITEHDFKTIDNIREDEILIWCQLSRDPDEKLNYDEMYKSFGFFVHMDGYEQARHRVQDIIQDSPSLFEVTADSLERGQKRWVDPKLKNQETLEGQFETMHQFAYVFRAKIDDLGHIEKDIRLLYREDETKDWVLALRDAARNELIKSAIIPAFRDPQSQLRLNNWSWYGKLMKHLTTNHGKEKELAEAFENVNKISTKIFEDVKSKMGQSSLDIAFPGTDLSFQFNEDIDRDVYKGVKIYVDDGYKSELTTKGAGIQSAAIISLFNYYTREVNTLSSALLCLEEPELYLHPHAKRTISDQLDVFIKRAPGSNSDHQVILTTHSNEFIRTTDSSLNIVVASKSQNGTVASRLDVSGLKHLIVDDNYNEIFFSDKVILCENYEKYIIRWVSDELYPGELNQKNISLISVGGKDQFQHFCKLLKKLSIKHYIFADLDFILRDDTDDISKYTDADNKPLKKRNDLTKLPRSFFEQECIYGENAKDNVEKIKSLREKIKSTDEEMFYKAKSHLDFTDQSLQADVKAMTSTLRDSGIGILDGEIENLSKDHEILSPGNIKLDLKKVFQLNRILNEGTSISDLIDIEPIDAFLKAILEKR